MIISLTYFSTASLVLHVPVALSLGESLDIPVVCLGESFVLGFLVGQKSSIEFAASPFPFHLAILVCHRSCLGLSIFVHGVFR